MALHVDPHWPRASEWLTGRHVDDPQRSLGLIGVPMNKSITPGHCDQAPAAVRAAMQRLGTWTGHPSGDVLDVALKDYGDLKFAYDDPESADAPLAELLQSAMLNHDAIALLGGDNGVTRPGVLGLGVPLEDVGLITLDAHFDLRTLENGLHNGNPIRALLESGLPGQNIIQIGIAPFANSSDYAEVAKTAGIRVHTLHTVEDMGFVPVLTAALFELSLRCSVIYVDCDVDVLDRAFAPACPGARPGGITPRELQQGLYACGRSTFVKVVDFVEVDPTKDINDATALVTGQLLLSFAAGLLRRGT
ncbi:MAG: arginase family protein [Armatimonadetes bacterium]|nr:arginase family protein [Armatimonadota bacterium]